MGSELEIVSPAMQCLTTNSSEETEIFVTPRKVQAIRAQISAKTIIQSANSTQNPNADASTRAGAMWSVASQPLLAKKSHMQAHRTGTARYAQSCDG